MTPMQRQAVDALRADGFAVVVESKEIVRMTKGADRRVVMADGSQKRGYHVEFKRAGQTAGEGV
ncbi:MULTISPECIES: hypothetical protein [Pseudomonas]|uniref:hypothetical protein n=1 Tax=Pseudomonas guariconensis TaxID=1288410 RepID=UPI002097C8D0|nr:MULTISPECIES: hypothetical protein [Pseudomonas]MCO7595036.1 hypothetical protein [Pseudomonas guariconensis]MCU7221085.1 hypothetical protein [Pseudomonas brassicacearum]